VVDGSQLTFDRVKRILDANGHGDSATMARAFKTFVKQWNIIDDDGKPIPITLRGIENAGLEMVTAITIEIVNALDNPTEPWGRAMTVKETGGNVLVEASDTPFPPFDPSARPAARARARAVLLPSTVAPTVSPDTPGRKSLGTAIALWVFLGLVGGHRYYVGRPVSGFLMTITLGGLGFWWVLDGFLVSWMVRRANAGTSALRAA